MSRHPPFRNHNAKRKTQTTKPSVAKRNLPKNTPPIEVTITHIGGRGDGIGKASYRHNYETKNHSVFVPDTLVGDVVIAQPVHITGQGIHAELRELLVSAPERKAPDCEASPACGGCQFQHMAQAPYQTWKSEMVRTTIAKSGLDTGMWRPDYFAKTQNRRRARLAYRRRKQDVLIGFRERGTHHIIYPAGCTILTPSLGALIANLRDDILLAFADGMTGEIEVTACDNGCDIVLHSAQSLPADMLAQVTLKASAHDIARLTLQEKNQPPTPLFVKEAPLLKWDMPDGAAAKTVSLYPASGSFLQADKHAEMVMKTDIFEALSGATTILDLFSGSGTLSAPLLFQTPSPHKVCAYDSVAPALAAYGQIADSHGLSMHLETHTRNLFDAPLTSKELIGFDAAIIDPPRAGAHAQMPALADSAIATIMMVSCNPHSFARDAMILQEGGYRCEWVRHIDQFALTTHSEIIACFTKQSETP